jgi:type II secretory pathway component PulM
VSVRVNLLPQATKAGAKATRQRGLAAALGLLLLLVLAGVYWWQSAEIRDAEDRLAQEELVAQGLQNEVNALSEYRDLDLELQAAT